MFLEYFRLREQPFGVTPDPRFLFPSLGHREALASLLYGIESNLGFGALIAEPGMGKTTLLFHILEQYRDTARTAFIFNTQCNSKDLLRSLLSELDEDASSLDNFQLHEKFKQILAREAEGGHRVIVVIDEAQNLGVEEMESVRLLSNFESAYFKMLHIILAGQQELAQRLSRPQLSQLQQRIPILTHLPNLSPQDVTSYIDHRLRIAGYQGNPLFTPEAVRQIAWLSGGVPRQINRICFNCLSLTYACSKPLVDLRVLEEVAADLKLKPLLQQQQQTVPYRATGTTGFSATAIPAPKPAPRKVPTPPLGFPKPAAVPAELPSSTTAAVSQQWVARAPQRPMRMASRLPAIARRRPLGSPWKAFARPLGLGAFYLALIGAGWTAVTRWIRPDFFGSHRQTESLSKTHSSAEGETDPPAHQQTARTSQKAPNPARAVRRTEKKSNAGTPRQNSAARKEASQSPTTLKPASMSELPSYGARPRSSSAPGAGVEPVSHRANEPSVSTGAQPELVRFVKPRYPEAARNQHIEGTVVLNAVVTKEGTVRGLRPVSGHPLLLQAAESAVRDWVYRPYQINGRPVDVDTEIVISFSLPKESNP
jgi:TonB family protein